MVSSDPLVASFCAHYGESNADALVVRLCRELLARAPTERFATPLEVLASCQGIRTIECGSLPTPSILFEHDGGFRIVLNEADPPERRRFSLAHEIVHTFFRSVTGYGLAHDSTEVERLCDVGAAELTMPDGRFPAILQASGLTIAGLRACSQEFATSLQASARRAIDITEQPAAVLIADAEVADDHHIPDASELRVASIYRSSTWLADDDPLLLDVARLAPAQQAFVNLDDRIGNIASPDSARRGMVVVEAAGYKFDLAGRRTRRVVVLLVPPELQGPEQLPG